MSDQGELAKRRDVPSDDANAHNLLNDDLTDDPTDPVTKPDSAAESDVSSSWSEPSWTEPSWSEPSWTESSWTESTEPEPEPEPERPPGRLVFPETQTPEGGRLEFSVPEDTAPEPAAYDAPAFGSAVSQSPAAEAETRTETGHSVSSAPAHAAWEGSLFDGGGDAEPGDERYAPVLPSGPSTPPKPGTPSSGNLRMPDWMRAESDDDSRSDAVDPYKDDDGRGSRIPLITGVGLLVVVLTLTGALGVYFLRPGDDAKTVSPVPTASSGPTSAGLPEAEPQQPPEKDLKRFPGTPSTVAGRITDAQAGLAYPRFGAPWQLPTKQNRLLQLGWSGQQIVVTERRGARLWYGQLLSGTLNPAEMSIYRGPGTERAAAVALARNVELRFYRFQHESQPFASQALTVDGRQGWLVSSYLRYRRPGVKATGELVVTAVIDTGRESPAVLFLSVPNTHQQLWPDVNYFLTHLKVVP